VGWIYFVKIGINGEFFLTRQWELGFEKELGFSSLVERLMASSGCQCFVELVLSVVVVLAVSFVSSCGTVNFVCSCGTHR
jgi:hypothetical protein